MVNVVDLMRLEPETEHPHGMSDAEFDALFTTDKPVIFAYHGYPWLIHRLTYRRHGHDNLHVRGYKEEGTTTTPFDMVMLNDLDRFHLVMDVIDRVPGLAVHGRPRPSADDGQAHHLPRLHPRARRGRPRDHQLEVARLSTCSRMTSSNGAPAARAASTPSTWGPAEWSQRSPGWASSGSSPSRAIQVSGSGGGDGLWRTERG